MGLFVLLAPGALAAFALTVTPSPAPTPAVPDAVSPPGASGEEKAALLLSLGLARDAERTLREEIAAGQDWARASLVHLLLRTGRPAEAEEAVTAWGGPDSLGTATNHFTWGRILEGEERWAEAAESYLRSAAAEPLLADHASFRAATTFQKQDAWEQALRYYERAGSFARSRTLASRAFWEAARIAIQLGDGERALENLEKVPRRSVIARADLLELEARIDRVQGNEEREARVLRDLLDRSPSSEQALEAADRLAEITEPTLADRIRFADTALGNRHATRAEREARHILELVEDAPDPVIEGQARVRLGKALIARRQYTSARRELAKMTPEADAEDRAEALLDRARCLWRLDQIDACLAEYDAIADADWPDEIRAAAFWEAGREAKDNRRWEEAALRLGEFQRLFPDDDYADDAAWHRGRALAELGRAEEAVAAFELLRIRYPDSRFNAEAAYWTASLRRKDGCREEECAAYGRLLAEHPDSYWSERARERLAGAPCPGDSSVAPAGEDLDPLEWLATLLPDIDVEDARKRMRDLRTSEPFRRARTLARTGLIPEAETELGGLRHALESDSAALLAFAQDAWLIGAPREAMRAVLVIKTRTGKPILSGALPASVARLLYPVDHLDAVLHWSREYGLDPWFVFAVMREESWFDSRAVSWAGAYGLLQIMPSTGRDLARRVGLRRFDRSDLFRPETNIRLGTFYLSRLLADLEREPALVLSAYNAGRGNALRWRRNVDGDFDVDRYVAGITYRETYGYVQRVTRTWAIYRQLYDGLLEQLDDASDEGTH